MQLASSYVSFPNLGWEMSISETVFSFRLFGIDINIRWYGLLIALGFLLAVLYAVRRYRQFGLDGDRMFDVVLVSALFGFVGARLGYVLFSDNLSQYLEDPLSILRVWEGGLMIYGGVILAFITAWWMSKLRKVNTLALFDIGSLGFLIGQGVGRWGNFFNQEAFGSNTNLPWGMTGDRIQAFLEQKVSEGAEYVITDPVHPTFLYESLWCLLGFVLLHILSKKAYKFNGQIFSLYLIWYGAARFVIEGLRTDSLMLGTMRVSQLIAAVLVCGGVALYLLLRAKSKTTSRELFAAYESTLSLDEEALEEGAEQPADDEMEEQTDEEPAEVSAAPDENVPEAQEVTDGD